MIGTPAAHWAGLTIIVSAGPRSHEGPKCHWMPAAIGAEYREAMSECRRRIVDGEQLEFNEWNERRLFCLAAIDKSSKHFRKDSICELSACICVVSDDKTDQSSV